jgi:hypothetical protein
VTRLRIAIHSGLRGRDWLPPARTLAEKAAVINVHYGTPGQIVKSIRAFPAFSYTTEVQFSVAYGTTDSRQRVAAIEAIASEIAPQLGWRPDDTAPDEPGPSAAVPGEVAALKGKLRA